MDEWYLDITDTPRARRRQYSEKAVGRGLRRGGSRIRFNPNAWDADNDGLVQDSTPFQRPAIPGVNDFSSRLRRQSGGVTGSRQTQREPRNRITEKPKLGDQLRRVLPARNKTPLNAHQRKNYTYGDISELDELPIRANRKNWLNGLTAKQISKLVVPANEDEYWQMWSDAKVPHLPDSVLKASRGLFTSSLKDVPSREIDFSPEAVEEMRMIVEQSLDESPAFKWAVENFGMQFVVKRTDKAVEAFNKEPLQKIYVDDQISRGIPKELIGTPVATTYGTSRTTFFNSGITDQFKFGESGYTLDDLSIIDGTAGGALRHEWGHYLMSTLLDDDELPTTARFFGGSSMYEAKAIAEKYNGDADLSKNLLSGLKDKSLPYARSAYAHTSMQEMFAEGTAAYLHPNNAVRHFGINEVLKKDIEKSLNIADGNMPWTKSGLSSGGRKSRRNNPDQLRLDIELPDEKLNRDQAKIEPTKSEAKKKKPFRPREPDNGPLTGKFLEIFKGVSSWEEFKERYNSLEIIYFDYETTGLGDTDKPIQLGAVRIKGGKVVDRFNVFMNPEKELSQWSLENLKDADGNPITQNWVNQQTTMKEAHAQFIAWAGKNPLLGGQYTPFDLGFLERTLKQQNLDFSHSGVIDSKAIADEVLPKWSSDNPVGPFAIDKATGNKFASSSLGPVAEFLGVDMSGGWHTADVDSETSALIVGKMIEYGIANPSAPKTVLDIEGIPRRQEEKRIKYAQAMSRYEKAVEEMELAEAKEVPQITVDPPLNRGKLNKPESRGLSSGATDRNLKSGSLSDVTETVEGKRKTTQDGQLSSWDEIEIYQIADKRIAFGILNEDDFSDYDGIEYVPINPFTISGYSESSKEGQDIALKWSAARAAYVAENGYSDPGTYVDALLYSGSRGDSSAMDKFEELAKKGEELIDEQRKLRLSQSELSEYRIEEMRREGVSDLGVDDLYLVHETKYDIQKDKDGNVILRPLGDYELKDDDGNVVDYHRDTLHFSLNHLAGGHMFRNRLDKSNIIIIPLRDVLRDNPDSLDALVPVDTFLSPKPGSPLVLSRDAVRIVDGTIDTSEKQVADLLKEMGASKIFTPGDTYTTAGVDAAVFKISQALGVNYALHADTIQAQIEGVTKAKDANFPYSARSLSTMSKNGRMRIADNKNRWSGGRKKYENVSGIDF